MKFHLLGLLLVASVMVNGGYGLKCYTCVGKTDNAACNAGGPTTCLSELDTCMTVLIYKGSNYVVSKQCLSKAGCDAATNYDGSADGVTLATTCCQADGCNANGAPRLPGVGHAALALLGLGVSVLGRALM